MVTTYTYNVHYNIRKLLGNEMEWGEEKKMRENLNCLVMTDGHQGQGHGKNNELERVLL